MRTSRTRTVLPHGQFRMTSDEVQQRERLEGDGGVGIVPPTPEAVAFACTKSNHSQSMLIHWPLPSGRRSRLSILHFHSQAQHRQNATWGSSGVAMHICRCIFDEEGIVTNGKILEKRRPLPKCSQ